jgi:pyruvate dehydrogenase E2 component (dihydrolipoamide acetyltransferase)
VAPQPQAVENVEVKPLKAKSLLGFPDYTDLPLTKYKTVTAERLTAAKQQIPHYYVTTEIEMDTIMRLREHLNKSSPAKITINDMLIKACAIACLKVPLANSSWMNSHIRTYKDTDVSVAVQTPIGLITPIVYRANLKGLSTIASEMKDLASRAKENKLKPEEFMGGTFTISNAGMFGITNLVPIVNPPQSAILGVGATIKRVVPNEGDKANPFKISSVMQVALSCDHRVIDGATGSEFLRELKKVVENPDLMML